MVDWDKDHADLSWTKPENDGGAPITGYVIEYKVTFENHDSHLNVYEYIFEYNYVIRKSLEKTG